jgi:hypothetical protein
MVMGRERPRSQTATFAPRAAGGVAHAPVSVPTLSGEACPDPYSDWCPISCTIYRTLWVANCRKIGASSRLSI